MKWVKRILIGLGGLILVAVLGAVVVLYGFFPRSRAAPDVKAMATPETIARGAYLAMNVTGCIACHSEVEPSQPGDPVVPGREGSGRDWGVIPLFPGRVRAANLTPDPETGIGRWTDGEILRAMREGIGRDGRALMPMMPYPVFAQTLSDDDALAIVAYLRSLRPIRNAVGGMELPFPLSVLVRTMPAPLERAPGPAPTDSAARGEWLLKATLCAECHNKVDEHMNPVPGGYMAGGAPNPVPGLGTVYATNITSDSATGIGAYTDEDLLRVLNDGLGRSGRPLWVMPWTYYRGLTEADKHALIGALRRVPPVVNAVPLPGT